MALAGATNFVQNSLAKSLGNSVEITLLFQYLNDIIHHPSQQTCLSAFMRKWKKLYRKGFWKTMIIRYSGTWPPNCLAPEELCKQQQWKDFVLKYDPSFSERELVDSENSPDYQPLNFKELIKLSFWKELYKTFGHQIVSHIFEKCAILFEVDEGLYLIVAYSGGLVHQRLSKYEGCAKPAGNKNGALSHISSTNPRNPYESLRSAPEEKSAKEKQSHPPVSPAPDEVRIVDKDPSDEQNKLGRYKRKKEEDISTKDEVLENEQEHQPPAKRQKMNIDPVVVEKGLHAAGSSSAPMDRWIKPRPEDLNKLIEHRNGLLNSYKLNRGSTDTPNPSLNCLNYIHVLKDEDFKSKNKLFVIKQKANVSITNPELPRDWKGLKISKDLIKGNEGKNEILINVYHISETLAKKLGIRLKPKGRYRKNRGVQHDGDVSIIAAEKVPVCTPTAVETTTISNTQSKEDPNSSISPLEVNLGDNGHIMSHLKPSCAFVSNIILPITACLYNKSSWSKWPVSHCLSKAGSEYAIDKASSLRKVVCAVLKMQVCSEQAYKYLIQVLTESWKDVCDNSIALNDIIFNIIQTHMKFKDIHRLVKSCVRHWRTKYAEKQERKNNRRVPWKETRENEPMNPPEVIEIDSSPNPTPELPATTISKEGCNGSPMEIFEISQSSSSSVVEMPNMVKAIAFTSNRSTGQSNTTSQTMASAEQRPTNKVAKAKANSKKKAELIRKSSGNTKKHRPLKGLRHPVPYNCIMQSLKQLFHILKIDTLLGSKHNIRGFFKFLRKAIILGGTKSGLHLGELMACVNPEESPLAQACGGDKIAAEIFMAKLVTWLFNDYVLVFLKTSFYITECSNTRFQMKFFLRELWTSASHKMRTRLLRQHALEQLEQKTFSQQRPNAVIRYIPKANNTLRSLLIRKKTAWSITDGELKGIKLLLYFIDAKISHHRMQLPSTIQNQWRRFCRQWKDMGSPKLYYLRMDIRDAFPSVSPEKLKEILFKMGGDRERQQHVVQKQYALFCGTNGKKLVRSSIFDSHCRSNWHSGIHIRPCIVLDLQRDQSVNIWKMLDNLTTMITSSSTVKIGKKLYDFRYGLPQGWGPSSVLCSIYYGFIDSTLYIPYLETHGRLFLRVVDDYLFITPVASEIVDLTQLIKIGCAKYELKMNEDKSETNIYVRSDVAVPEMNCEHTIFCGWNFCFTHGHVSRDYQKYNGQDFCSTITFQMLKSINSPEQFIRLRGTLIMPARIKPILMDPSINCSKRILLTVYEASVLLGFRFYALCRVVYPSLSAIKDLERSKVLLESVRICCARLARFVFQICHRTTSISGSPNKVSCEGDCCGGPSWKSCTQTGSKSQINSSSLMAANKDLVSYNTFLYTALRGFRLKLQIHSVVFNDHVLPEINRYISKLGRKLGQRHCEAILQVVGDRMPTCFQDISC